MFIFFRLLIFSLNGPEGMVRPLPIQLILLKQTNLNHNLIEILNPSSNIATS